MQEEICATTPKLFTIKIGACFDHRYIHAPVVFDVEYNPIHLVPVKTLSISK